MATLLAGISLVTIQFAPILAFSLTVKFPIILAPQPIYTLSHIIGAPLPLLSKIVFDPIVT